MRNFIENNITEKNGSLYFAGWDIHKLINEYSSPVYLFDEEKIRENCRMYINAVREILGENYKIMYASKAASFKRIYEIMTEEGMNVDVVSCGEIATCVKAGFNLNNAFFHSNNKTDEDIKYAIDKGVGYFVVDNLDELFSLDRIAKDLNVCQKILLRLTPGIDPHTFSAVATGKVDSKFGFSIKTGQAEEALKEAIQLKNISLQGFHCHVGSQIFDSDVYFKSTKIMIDFIKEAKEKFGFETCILDLGGGLGVRYVDSDPIINIPSIIKDVCLYIKKLINENNLLMPIIGFEPGRSIVANAGMTIYTVGSVKTIPSYKTYVSVDGGMTDNVRYAMYKSSYTILPVDGLDKTDLMKCTIAGRCCESGDIIQTDILLPKDIKRGDLVAVCTTGAYNYSMASNYNRIPRLPIVMLARDKSYIACRRETFDDITSLDE